MGIIQFSVFLRNTRKELNPQIIIMNPKSATLAALAMASAASGTIIIGTVAATTGVVTVGSGALLSGALLGGVAILKGLLIGAALKRGKRSVEGNDDEVFLVLNNAEPAQCYRRLICDLGAGAIPDQDNILSLFNTEVSPISPKFDYVNAAKVGKLVRNADSCEVRYSCPLSTTEISKIIA